MEQFVLVMTHPPDRCPTANETIRKRFLNAANEIPKLAKKLGVDIVVGPPIGTEHKSVTVAKAETVQAIRDFILQSGLIQWNGVEVMPVITMEKAIEEVEKLKPIY